MHFNPLADDTVLYKLYKQGDEILCGEPKAK